MARTINAAALAKLATDKGTKPVMVLEVFWGNDTTARYYADKEIPGQALGTILEVSGLDEVVQVSGGGTSQQLTVKLDDTSGELKTIFDTVDVHKKSVRVFQWFEGLQWSERFLVFRGQINSPVEWSEHDRTLSFTIMNRIEDVEVGFSAEEGDFAFLPEELIGQAWPLCFGTTINVPALQIVPVTSGTLASGVGIKDFTLALRLEAARRLTCPLEFTGYACHYEPFGISFSLICNAQFADDASCSQQRCTEIERLSLMLAEQRAYEFTTITVFGGNKFPQDVKITLVINGGEFTGYMHGETFTITSRKHPRNDGTGGVIDESDAAAEARTRCEGQATPTPPTEGFPNQVLAAMASKIAWDNYRKMRSADFFWAPGGSKVTLKDTELVYVANIIPSTILTVKAHRTIQGNEYLLTVPSTYYSVRQTNFNGYLVMEIVMTKALSNQNLDSGGGWKDDIYITQTASVGPNTVDIMEWLIETYTGYGMDATSFNSIRTKIDNYPMHFPLLQRRNLVTVLQELATYARCAIFLKDDTFYLKYLAETPTAVLTITDDDILPASMEIGLSRTEDVVTKYVAEWKKDYAIDKPNTLILRHNVKAYGTQEKKYDYYPFNILQLVRKAATFWLIRKSNTWKRVKFTTALTYLNLEAFDAIYVDFEQLSDDPVLVVVEKALYNSANRTIEFECWTPIKAGSRVPYDFAFPAAVEEKLLFPSQEERDAGFAGSGKDPNFSTIAPPQHPLSNPQTGFSGFTLACNGDAVEGPIGSGQCRDDHGDKHPSDINDTKPEPDTTSDQTGDISTGSAPISNGAGGGYYSDKQQTKEETKQALSAGGSSGTEASRASDAADANRQRNRQPNQLPDPSNGGDKSDGELAQECISTLTFTYISPTLVALQDPNGPPTSNTPGATGRPAISGFSGPHKLFFNSATAAKNFQDQKAAEYGALYESWGFAVGGTYMLHGGQLVLAPPTCEDDINEGGITGYRNGDPQGGDDFPIGDGSST